MDKAACPAKRCSAGSMANCHGRITVPAGRVAVGSRRAMLIPALMRSRGLPLRKSGLVKANDREEMVKRSVGLPEPLQRGTFDEFLNADGELVEEDEPEYNLKYLYDGGCTVCMSLVSMLKSRRGHEGIYFEDISDPGYSPRRNAGISYEDAMDTIHVIKKDGDIITGMDALTALYGQVGLGWVFKLANLPFLNKAAEIVYKLISKNRLGIAGGMDAVMAVGRINMEKEGTGTCEADGECRAKPEPEKEEKSSSDEDEDVPITGSWVDHEHVLGIYTYGLGEGLRAAPIDANNGKFLVPGFSVRLEGHDYDSLVTAIDDLISRFNWKGAIGLGLPGLLSRRDSSASEWLPEALKSDEMVEGSVSDSRKNKHEFEQYLKDACNHDVVVMTGAEACGYAEVSYGAARDLDGLVLVITIGRGFGAALFENKILVRNISGILTDQLYGWNSPEWADATCPEADCKDPAKWAAWGRRVEHFLMELENFCQPDCIVVSGSGSQKGRYEKLVPHLSQVSTPLRVGQLGQLAGVKGAAAGAADELVLRDDMAVMRAAIGKFWAKSPSAMNEGDIRKAYDAMDTDGDGELTPLEVAEALHGMGVDLPKQELRELVYDMDTDRTGSISFDEFKEFWSSLVADQAVTLMHTLAEYNNAIEEESRSNRLLVLEVGFTYCKPCRRFEPKYHAFAERFTDARFLRVNGNENSEMVTLGRDILKVKSSPSFYFLRNGEVVYKTSGANEAKIEDAILRNLLPGETGFIEDYKPNTEFDPAPAPEAKNTQTVA